MSGKMIGSDILIALFSGFLGVVAGIFVTAVSKSFYVQRREFLNAALCVDAIHSNMNLLLTSIVKPMTAVYEENFKPQSYGNVVNLQKMGLLNARNCAHLSNLNYNENMVTRFFLYAAVYIKKINDYHAFLATYMVGIEKEVQAIKFIGHPRPVLSEREFNEQLETLINLNAALETLIVFVRLLIRTFKLSLSQNNFETFTILKLIHRRSLMFTRNRLLDAESMLVEIETYVSQMSLNFRLHPHLSDRFNSQQ
jgi:hypothetical protein